MAVLILLLVVLPVGLYLLFACLPEGRGVTLANAALAALLALAAVSLWFGVGPLASGDGAGDGIGGLAAGLAAGAAILALSARGLRAALGPGRPGWAYPLLVAGLLLLAGVPALRMLGV